MYQDEMETFSMNILHLYIFDQNNNQHKNLTVDGGMTENSKCSFRKNFESDADLKNISRYGTPNKEINALYKGELEFSDQTNKKGYASNKSPQTHYNNISLGNLHQIAISPNNDTDDQILIEHNYKIDIQSNKA